MSLATDVELAGAGYMVATGTYRRTQDGMPEGRTGRVVVKDFFGGQRRALQLERDRGWDSEGVGPALFGQGVEPWPFQLSHADSVIATVTTVRAPHLVVGDRAYVAVGRFLYRSVILSASAWANVAQVADVGAGKTITRLVYYRGKILLLCGNGLDVQQYDPGTGTTTTWVTGVKAQIGIGYARQLVWADPTAGNEDLLKLSTGGTGPDERELDAPIVNMGLHDGKVAIATRQSLWLLGGRADTATSTWLGDPVPFFTQGIWSDDEDFLFLLSYGGKLYTWLHNQVMEWTPTGDRQGWRASGLEGTSCHGATVAGGMLIVCTTSRTGASETWAFDGSGWWLILTSTSQTRVWPMHTGGAGNIDLVTFRDGSTSVTYDLFRLVYRHASATNYRGSGAYRTSLLDAGERDKLKAWRKIGATFTSPEIRGNPLSTDIVTLTLSYSIDGGATFTIAGSTAVNDPHGRQTEIDAAIANAAAVSSSIMLRLEFASVVDWSPVLTGLWAEYELLDAPARRRRWSFAVHARDAAVQRDGAIATRTGRQLAADLWAAWELGLTVPFRDLDFDMTGATASVRIVGIAEELPKPADTARWGESTLALTLVEV
ncbi:MAG: hypothetical protein ACRDJW_12905 [Thermomicrobiales bacterium]